jgi:predicted nucleotidyltransferase
MLTLNDIRGSINEIVVKYPIKKLSLFGSYAEGKANEESDVDFLVEFSTPNISLFTLYIIKEELENKLHKQVDLIHSPLDEGALIVIGKVVDIYEQ